MKTPIWHVLILALVFLNHVDASIGDNLPDYVACTQSCNILLQCPASPKSHQFGLLRLPTYSLDDFRQNYELNFLSRVLFHWDCALNCRYKCMRFVTEERLSAGLPVVQFYGKWPFWRVFGITELFSTLFSLANLYANYHNIPRIYHQYLQNRDASVHNGTGKSANEGFSTMYIQYLILLAVSCVGWTFSSIFHIRDTALTETLDYIGAIGIILCNFNVICVRYFELFLPRNLQRRVIFQLLLALAYVVHIGRMLTFWDYDYNVKFNLCFGVTALVLWLLHSRERRSTYSKNYHVYNNSMQLLPYETRILSKLEYVALPVSKSKLIPLLPVYLNALLLFGMALELIDFVPIGLLIDAHSLWHLFTIFPALIWFDWNIWDMELLRVSTDVAKVN